MSQAMGVVRRMLWWCAAVDVEIMSDPKCPGIDRIKYAIVGALICITSFITTLGWMHNASLLFDRTALPFSIAPALGILMGVLVLSMERLLIVSIPANVTGGGKFVAFLWRAALGSFTATIMTAPVALGYFKSEIISTLDGEKLFLMTEKRKAVDTVFGLTDTTATLERLDSALATNRQYRDRFSIEIEEINAKVTDCGTEETGMRRTLEPRIVSAQAQRDALRRQIDGFPTQYEAERYRINTLTIQIGNWKAALATKAQVCAAFDQSLQTAKQTYYIGIQNERKALLADRAQHETVLGSARIAAQAALQKSDEIIQERTTPTLAAQVRALHRLAADDWFVRALISVFFSFFYLVDLLPILAKLLSRSVYERLLGARQQKLIAEIESDVVVASSQAAINADNARAEQAGFQSFAAQSGGIAFVERAAAQMKFKTTKDESLELFQYIETITAAFVQAQLKVDTLDARLQGGQKIGPEALQHIRHMLRSATRNATSGLERISTNAANSNDGIALSV